MVRQLVLNPPPGLRGATGWAGRKPDPPEVELEPRLLVSDGLPGLGVPYEDGLLPYWREALLFEGEP